MKFPINYAWIIYFSRHFGCKFVARYINSAATLGQNEWNCVLYRIDNVQQRNAKK